MIDTETHARAADLLRQRKAGFEAIYANDALRRYLMTFCRANESCFHPDPRLHAVAEGRREVWLLFQTFHDHSIEDLLKIYPPKEGDDNV